MTREDKFTRLFRAAFQNEYGGVHSDFQDALDEDGIDLSIDEITAYVKGRLPNTVRRRRILQYLLRKRTKLLALLSTVHPDDDVSHEGAYFEELFMAVRRHATLSALDVLPVEIAVRRNYDAKDARDRLEHCRDLLENHTLALAVVPTTDWEHENALATFEATIAELQIERGMLVIAFTLPFQDASLRSAPLVMTANEAGATSVAARVHAELSDRLKEERNSDVLGVRVIVIPGAFKREDSDERIQGFIRGLPRSVSGLPIEFVNGHESYPDRRRPFDTGYAEALIYGYWDKLKVKSAHMAVIFAANDAMAIAAERVARGRAGELAHRVMVCGFDGIASMKREIDGGGTCLLATADQNVDNLAKRLVRVVEDVVVRKRTGVIREFELPTVYPPPIVSNGGSPATRD